MITGSCVCGTQGAENTPLHVPVMHDAGVTAAFRLVIECAVVSSAVAVRSVACNAGMEGHAGICPPSFAIRTQQSGSHVFHGSDDSIKAVRCPQGPSTSAVPCVQREKIPRS